MYRVLDPDLCNVGTRRHRRISRLVITLYTHIYIYIIYTIIIMLICIEWFTVVFLSAIITP